MSDTPDIPALRTISAERLAVGDMYYGGVLDLAAQRKGWAVIEQEGQEVADVTHYAGTNRVDVIVKTPEGILTLAMFNDSQVLIEFKGHPNAVTTPGPLTRRFDAPQIEIALSTLADLYENSDDNTGDYLSEKQQEVAELVRHAKADIDNADSRDPGDRNWWEADYRVLDASGQVTREGTEQVIADDEEGAGYLAWCGLDGRTLDESGTGKVVIDAVRKI